MPGMHSQLRAGFAVKESEALAGPAPDGSFIAEGDSGFRLPHILYPPTMADFLSADYPITNLAHWGDELGKMKRTEKGLVRPLPKDKECQVSLVFGRRK